jgi:hypothetical protein
MAQEFQGWRVYESKTSTDFKANGGKQKYDSDVQKRIESMKKMFEKHLS